MKGCGRKLGPYDCCSVVCGDCLELMKALPDGCVDAVITSPPYNLGSSPWPHLGHWKPGDSPGGKSKWRNGSDGSGGVTYATICDAMPWTEYVEGQRASLRECWRIITYDGAIFYNHKPRAIGGRLWLPLELNPGLVLRQIVTWARAGGMNFNPTAYVPTYEWVMVIAKSAFRLRDKAASGAGDVWYIPQEACKEHPAPFPEELPTRILETTSTAMVLDPYIGWGTTAVAAKKLGRHFLGFEISEEYCRIARERIARVEAQPALFQPKAEQLTLEGR